MGPSAAIFKMLKQADPYKNIYTCTVLVKEKVPAKPRAAVTKKIAAHKVRGSGCEIATGGGTRCTKKVTLNTGFGGLARAGEAPPSGRLTARAWGSGRHAERICPQGQ